MARDDNEGLGIQNPKSKKKGVALKNLSNILRQAQKVQERIAQIQEEMGSKLVDASAGGGMVKAVANGKQEIVSIEIDPEIAVSGDKEMIQDLVVAAVNEALRKSKELFNQEVSKLTGGFSIPGIF